MNSIKQELKPQLKLVDASLLVAGSMIGSGIFIVSADMARNVGSAGWLILIWLITGIMTLVAAISYGELGAMFPKAGGQYVYLKEAYNPLVGFLYGWSFFAVIQTGTIAAVGVAFAKFTAYLVPQVSETVILFRINTFSISSAQVLAIGMIILLTYINTKGIRLGKAIQKFFTLTKLLSLLGLIVFGIVAIKPSVWQANWASAWQIKKLNPAGSESSYLATTALAAVASAMVGSIFSSDAWNNVTFVAGELKNPRRNVGLSLFTGTLIVTLIYISANLIYLGVLPLHQIAFAERDRVAVAASQVIFGNAGTVVIALMIMISTFGCNNGLILSGARVYYTMAQDRLFFKRAARLNKAAVPAFGLWLQCLMAGVLCLSGKYGDLLDMISFVVVLFYILTIIGIFILRKKQPDIYRPYRALGYPFLPALYVILGTVFCFLLICYKPDYTWPGLIIVLIGVPLYFLQKKSVRTNP
jgi:APA family basic amino acid/polyamine antiporter